MARQKNDGKGRLGGRAKGTPNKATTDLKTWVASILDGGRDRFVESLDVLEPSEYIRVFTGLLNYVLPKQAPTTPEDVLRKEKEMMQGLDGDLLEKWKRQIEDGSIYRRMVKEAFIGLVAIKALGGTFTDKEPDFSFNSDGLKNGLKTVIMQKITTRLPQGKPTKSSVKRAFFGRKQVINKLGKMQRYGR